MGFSVAFGEMLGWPRSEWQAGEFDAERRVFVKWEDRVTFLLELDSYPNTCYPYDDGPANAIVRQVKINPLGKQIAPYGNYATYKYAIIQIRHSTRGPIWDESYGAYVDEKLFPAGQYQMVSRKNLRWADGSVLNANDEPHMDMTLYEYTVSFSRLNSLPSWILTRPGVCNSNIVVGKILPITFAPQTLKFNGVHIHATWSLGKLPKFDVTAKYLFKSSEWNKFWKPDGGSGSTGGWENLYTKDGNQYIQHTPIPIQL